MNLKNKQSLIFSWQKQVTKVKKFKLSNKEGIVFLAFYYFFRTNVQTNE